MGDTTSDEAWRSGHSRPRAPSPSPPPPRRVSGLPWFSRLSPAVPKLRPPRAPRRAALSRDAAILYAALKEGPRCYRDGLCAAQAWLGRPGRHGAARASPDSGGARSEAARGRA